MATLKRFVAFGLFLGTGAFTIYDATDLEHYNIGDACVKALSADVACNPYIRSFMRLGYQGSLENVTLTDEICVDTCSGSLREWFGTVSSDCTGETFGSSASVPTRSGGYIWAGWNETCIKDPETEEYCNDIIDGFSDVNEGEDLPRAELCHPCYVRRLAMMQSSQYSIYDEYYKEELEYVYKTCGGSGPTEIPPPLKQEEPVEEFCLTENYYTTKKGDTCDSISKAYNVSGAFLYMGNQEAIGDCHNIPTDIKLCLPMTCKTYYVKPDENCFGIETSLGISWDTLRFYNSWISRDCSNLQTGTDFYGKSVCISSLGDTSTPADYSAPLRKISSVNGPNILRVSPPEDVDVAEGTTLMCGKWHVVTESDTCHSICTPNFTCYNNIMQDINPSLDEPRLLGPVDHSARSEGLNSATAES
ncbi:hypothetical protein G7Z17_g3623 [Cylindrodendrum hubeiense]|uniref:LysM domain-containing protein n=1 Tax=Cylindrodendrum hubeiense TaxID=595255 RepID=A0A9P5HC97_9HYPO|nr:hypothetical protein G7Z17_g3623 [Cylindrodendrum hubeiense]